MSANPTRVLEMPPPSNLPQRVHGERRAFVVAAIACAVTLCGIAGARALSGTPIGPRGPAAATAPDHGGFVYFPGLYEDRAQKIEDPVPTF